MGGGGGGGGGEGGGVSGGGGGGGFSITGIGRTQHSSGQLGLHVCAQYVGQVLVELQQ